MAKKRALAALPPAAAPAKVPSGQSPQMLQDLAKKVELERLTKCMDEVKAVMAKHRCTFAPRPKWLLMENDVWGTVIELGFKVVP